MATEKEWLAEAEHYEQLEQAAIERGDVIAEELWHEKAAACRRIAMDAMLDPVEASP